MVSIFGFFLVIGMFYYIKNNFNNNIGKNLFFLSIVSLLVLDIGYVAKIGIFTLEYNYFFSILNGFFVIYYLWKNKSDLNKKDLKFICIFLGLLVFSLLYPLIFNNHYYSVSFNDSWDLYFSTGKKMGYVSFSKHSIGMFARVVIFIFSTYIFYKTIKKDEINKYSLILYRISIVIILLSLVEFVITNCINGFAFRHFAMWLFGRSESTYELPRISFFGLYSPMLFMREPSSYVRALFIFGINDVYIFRNRKSFKKEAKYILGSLVAIFVLIVFSKSLSGYIYIIGLSIIIWSLLKNKKYKIILTIIVFIFLLCMSLLLKDRLLKIISSFNKFDLNPNMLSAQSEIIRFYSINNNFNLFLNNFLVGCGFGTVYCYSSVISLLANIGLFGVSIYIFILNYLTNLFSNIKFFSWLTFIVITITGLFIGHMSYIMYLETFAYELLMLKMIDCSIKISS